MGDANKRTLLPHDTEGASQRGIEPPTRGFSVAGTVALAARKPKIEHNFFAAGRNRGHGPNLSRTRTPNGRSAARKLDAFQWLTRSTTELGPTRERSPESMLLAARRQQIASVFRPALEPHDATRSRTALQFSIRPFASFAAVSSPGVALLMPSIIFTP
jgi:hypothetical protein